MSTPVPASGDKPTPRADHGYRNEVNWDGGQGRQPYSNQGDEEAAAPNVPPEHAEGDRGQASGVAIDQLEQAKGKP